MNGLDFWGRDTPDPETRLQYATYVCNMPEMVKLRQLLEQQLEEIRKTRLNKVNYEKPSWPYIQADATGREYQIVKTLKLFTVD